MPLSERPLVSVVTGTWQRHDLLLEAIANVRQQTYRPLEHVIVSDGPDPELRREIAVAGMVAFEYLGDPIYCVGQQSDVPIRFVELGRHWSSFLAASLSTAPFLVAQLMASGPLQCWLADDERMAPDHIASLVDLLDATDSDFVFSKAKLWARDDPSWDMVIGHDPPMLGTITNALYRVELLDYRMFTFGVGSATDWDQVSHWMAAGARWAMLDRVTLTHRLDKFGEGPDFREHRQPLRGHQERTIA